MNTQQIRPILTNVSFDHYPEVKEVLELRGKLPNELFEQELQTELDQLNQINQLPLETI